MKSQFTVGHILWARDYWRELTYKDLLFFWKHYTQGKGQGMYNQVNENTCFLDYLVLSAQQSQFEQTHDI